MKISIRIPSRLILTVGAAALCSITVLLPARTHASAPQYTVTVLGGPGAAYGINDSGQAAGSSTQGAAVWNGTTPTNLGIVSSSSLAYGISNNGGAVGTSLNSQFITYDAFQFGGGYSGLYARLDGTIGGPFRSINVAYGINDSGQAAGFASTNGLAAVHAVRWTGGSPTDLGTLGGKFSEGTGINATGQVVGSSQITGNGSYHAVVWNGTIPTDLGALSGTSRGSGINALGQVAGWSNYLGGPDYWYHAVVWNGTTMTDLGTLGGDDSRALAINDSGDVVGMSSTSGNASDEPFLYTGGTMYDLKSLLVSGSGITSLTVFANNTLYA